MVFCMIFNTKYKTMSLPFKAGLWFTVCSIIQRGISVLSMPVFTRLLDTSQFGEYSLFLSWESFVSLLVTLNIFSEVFNKGLSDYAEDRDEYTSEQVGLLSMQMLTGIAIYMLFRQQINSVVGFSTPLVLIMFVGVYFTAITSFWFARKRFEYKYLPVIAVTLTISLSSILFGVVFVSVVDYEHKIIARIVSNYIAPVVLGCFILIKFCVRSRKLFSLEVWKSTLLLSVPLLPHYLSQITLNQTDKIMIGWFDSASSVAIYGIAHSAGLLLVLINNGINSSFVPWMYGKLKEKDFSQIASVSNALCFLVAGCNAVLMLFAPEAVLLLSTQDYINAIWCIAPIATSVVFVFTYTLFVNVEIYYGKTSYVAFASMVAAIVNVVLNYVFIPKYGYVAAAYTTAFSYLFTMFAHFALLRGVLKRNLLPIAMFDYKSLFISCGLIIVCAAAVLLLYGFSFARYVAICIAAISAMLHRDKIKSIFIFNKK